MSNDPRRARGLAIEHAYGTDSELNGDGVEALATTVERTSRELEAVRATARMAFVDVSANFDAGLERAEHLLPRRRPRAVVGQAIQRPFS